MLNIIKSMVKSMFPLGYKDEFLLLIKMAIPLVIYYKIFFYYYKYVFITLLICFSLRLLVILAKF